MLVHAPAAERPYVEAGDLVNGRNVMHNDFVIVGPGGDPAGIRGLTSVNDVMRTLASRAAFVSRGDDSGQSLVDHLPTTFANVMDIESADRRT